VICNNCHLFDPESRTCQVTVIVNGERYELPVHPNDDCHWMRLDKEAEDALARASSAMPHLSDKLGEEAAESVAIRQIRVHYGDG
jgi:hypothetical protein